MAEQNLSFYANEVAKYFPSIAANVVQRLNDSTNQNAITYRHRRMLTPEFSPTLKWESLTVSNYIVAADVIAMDSALPLKRRDAISQANGDIPKLGLELKLTEKQLTELDILARLPNRQAAFIEKLFSDTPKVIQAPYETLEYMFLLGLSSGITVVQDANNVGTGVRIDYGYPTTNKFGVVALWSNPTTGKPFSDLARAKARATTDGKVIIRWMLDEATFNNMAKTDEVKQVTGFNMGFAGATIPTPSLAQINKAALDQYGYQFEIVERSVTFEKNGNRTPLKPWQVGSVIGITRENVGRLFWGNLAEMNHPVDGVTYQTVSDYILVSKFRTNRPSLSEHTASQAMVVPIIEDVTSIYQVDTLTIQA